MLSTHNFPICEYDTNCEAIIRAENFLEKTLPQRCVITFFRKELHNFAQENNLPIIEYLHSEILDIPIYRYHTGSEEICLTMPFATAPGAACTLEELHAMGCEKFIICGGAGSLVKGTPIGEIILPTSALRDEGTSYHYLPPSREVSCHNTTAEIVSRELANMGIPFRTGKTWTTDALYRETPAMIQRHREEGCITVEMETAAFFALSKYYDLPLAQLLYAGDDVSGATWESRSWNKQKSIRENLLFTAVELAAKI